MVNFLKSVSCVAALVAILTIICGPAAAEPKKDGAGWSLKRYAGDWSKVTEGIKKSGEADMIPVGLACTIKYIFALSVPNSAIGATDWAIMDAGSVEGLQQMIMSMSKKGFVPFDVDFSGDKKDPKAAHLNVLFVKVPSAFEAWQMVSSEKPEGIRDRIGEFWMKGYFPAGVTSVTKGGVTVMMIKAGGLGVTDWDIYCGKFDEKGIIKVVDDYVKKGFTPIGVHIDGARGAVTFLKFGGKK